MFINKIKQLLSEGQVAWGASLADASDLIAKLTVNTGVDFLWVDLEHRPYETEAVRWIPIICRASNCACVIRVDHRPPDVVVRNGICRVKID